MRAYRAYTHLKVLYRLQYFFFRTKVVWFLWFLFLSSNFILAQEESDFEETSVSLKIPKIGVVEAPAFINKEFLYLPVTDIFTFLKIQNTPTPGYDSISGFFINQEATYLIDRSHNRIYYQNKVFELSEGDLIKTENNLYLRSAFFGQVFGMTITFEFRALTATLSTNFELPVIREMRMELMRSDLNRLKGVIKADTIIGRKYPLFHFGMADWSVSATQQFGGKSNVWLNLALGSVIAGGEANVSLTYSNLQKFSSKYQYYRWHYANNDRTALRQVMIGKIGTTTTSSIYAPLVGVQLTNSPTTFRRSFGTYTLTDYTEPGWLVELYVNNVLVDYLKADASGFFTFEVPLVYGTSSILLRFYGPWGEERSREKSISIPFNFLPTRQLEYTVTAAIVEDGKNSVFSRANVNYGVSRRMTIGGGVEYLSSVKPINVIPFVNVSMRLGSGLLVSGEYSYGVRFKGILSWRLPWNIQMEFNYFKYHQGQTAVSTSFLEERKMMLSVPVRLKRISSLVRLTIDQVLLKNSRDLTAELLISATAFGVSANLTTYGLFYDPVHPYIYSSFSLGFRLPARFIVVPQVQYDYTRNQFVSVKLEVERQVFKKGALKFAYEHNFAVNIQTFQLGLRYDFPFAQTGFNAIYGKYITSTTQSARGSLMFDGKTQWIGANNMTSVGKGGLVLIPFLDLNVNGKRDSDEPRVSGLNVHITGGRTEQSKRDSSIRIFDLEPFTSYFIEIDKNSFDNVAWQIRKPVISAAIDPNQFKMIEIPVAVYGECSGMVYMKQKGELFGQSRVIISFFRDDSTLVGRTLTEPDGYFSFLGLAPGNFIVKVDEAQLRNLKMTVAPDSYPFSIVKNSDGDLAGSLDFVIESLTQDTVGNKEILPAEIVMPAEIKQITISHQNKDTIPTQVITHPDSLKSQPGVESASFTIQVGAFSNQTNAINAKFRLQSITNFPISIVFDAKFYKVRINQIYPENSVSQLLIKLSENGFPGSFILKK